MDLWILFQTIIWLVLIALLSFQYLKKPELNEIDKWKRKDCDSDFSNSAIVEIFKTITIKEESLRGELQALNEKYETIVHKIARIDSEIANLREENTKLKPIIKNHYINNEYRLTEATTNHSGPKSMNTVNLKDNDYKESVNLIVKQNEQKHFDVNKIEYTEREKEILFYSVKNKKLDKINNILLRHLPIDFQNKEDQTLLHVAVENNHVEIVKILLDHNIDLKIKDNDENTPFDIALDKNFEQIVKILIENGVDVNEIIKESDISSTTRLHQAAFKGRDDIIKLLHKNGADLNIIDKKNGLDDTALFESLSRKKTKAAETLIRLGADIFITDINGRTPLHIAAFKKLLPLVKLLVEKGAHVNDRDNFRRSVLHYAASSENPGKENTDGSNEITKYLVEMGAKEE